MSAADVVFDSCVVTKLKAMPIAIRYDRSVYDALFVALARDLGITGVTTDEPLYNAVRADFPEIKLLRDV